MKVTAFLLFSVLFPCLFSCQREVLSVPVTNPIPSIDSSPAGSLIRYTHFNAVNDSSVESFRYNAKGSLIKSWYNDDSVTAYEIYLRDDKDRLIKFQSTGPKGSSPEGNYGGTVIIDVIYADDISDHVAYSVAYNTDSADKRIDSVLYFYENNLLSKAFIYDRLEGKLVADYIRTYSYDSKGNVLKYYGYKPEADGTSTFNLGYDFEYNNHPNPFYAHDDVLNTAIWTSLSPNYIVKMTVHYDLSGEGDVTNSDDNVYEYDDKGRIVSVSSAPSSTDKFRNVFYYK